MTDTDTANMHVTWHGQGDADIVFVHGFQQSHTSWEPLTTGLDTGRFRMALPDLPGCGQSPPPASWRQATIPEMALGLARLIRTSELRRPVIVGHSLGAAIALQLALDEPAMASALILFAPASTRGLDFVPDDRFEQLAHPTRQQQRALLRAAFERLPEPSELAAMEQVVAGAHPHHIEGAARSMRDFTIADRLASITVPSLVIAGDRDRHVPLPNHLATWKALPRAGLHVFHGVGHVPFREEPAVSQRLIEELCAVSAGAARNAG